MKFVRIVFCETSETLSQSKYYVIYMKLYSLVFFIQNFLRSTINARTFKI